MTLNKVSPLSKRILIIDDEPDLVKVVGARFRGHGYQTLTASNGQEGLRLAKEICPALIILDLKLPKLAGEDVCRAIREDHDKIFRQTPILILTVKSDEVDRVIGKVLGANHYLTKPFEFEVLLSKVKELIDR